MEGYLKIGLTKQVFIIMVLLLGLIGLTITMIDEAGDIFLDIPGGNPGDRVGVSGPQSTGNQLDLAQRRPSQTPFPGRPQGPIQQQQPDQQPQDPEFQQGGEQWGAQGRFRWNCIFCPFRPVCPLWCPLGYRCAWTYRTCWSCPRPYCRPRSPWRGGGRQEVDTFDNQAVAM